MSTLCRVVGGESNRQHLRPVLIYLLPDDIEVFLQRTIQIKDAEWAQGGQQGTWVQHILAAFEQQKWLTDRSLAGIDGFPQFMVAWSDVAEQLYTHAPFPKVKSRNSQVDWDVTLGQMCAFLKLQEPI